MRKNPYFNPTPAYRGDGPPELPRVDNDAIQLIVGQLMRPSQLELGEQRNTRAPQAAHHSASLKRRDDR